MVTTKPHGRTGGEKEQDRMKVRVEVEDLSALVVQEITAKTTNRWCNPTYPMITAFYTCPLTHTLKKAASNI